MGQKYLVFVSAARQLCGVEAFSRLLAQHFGPRAATHVLDADLLGLGRALRSQDAVVFNFPIVGWKRHLFTPGLAALVVRLMELHAALRLINRPAPGEADSSEALTPRPRTT